MSVRMRTYGLADPAPLPHWIQTQTHVAVPCRKRTLFRYAIIEKNAFKVWVNLAFSEKSVYRLRSLYMPQHHSPTLLWRQAPHKPYDKASTTTQDATLRVGYRRQLTGTTAIFQAFQSFYFSQVTFAMLLRSFSWQTSIKKPSTNANRPSSRSWLQFLLSLQKLQVRERPNGCGLTTYTSSRERAMALAIEICIDQAL